MNKREDTNKYWFIYHNLIHEGYINKKQDCVWYMADIENGNEIQVHEDSVFKQPDDKSTLLSYIEDEMDYWNRNYKLIEKWEPLSEKADG